jgi:hypothetical protein
MASTTLNVAVPRAVATRSRARRGGMPPVRLALRRGVRCAAGEEVPLGVQIETALMDAFPPRYVGDQTRAHPELERTRGAFRRGDETHQTKPSSIFSDVSVKDGCTGKSAIDASLR